ncbi:hypothetical protein DITRI_Ditri07aG0008100 [Diplodiscus trichospermus]
MGKTIAIGEEPTEWTVMVEEDEETEIKIEECRKEMFSVPELVAVIKSELDVLNNCQPAVSPNYCIFRIPAKLRGENAAPYNPQYVRIGPLANSDRVSRHNEEQKKRYLHPFLQRANYRTPLENFIELVERFLQQIRGCYERTYYRYLDNVNGKIRQDKPVSASDFSSLAKMILVDAGFILELFLRDYSKE